jgi:hypothetical protein
MDLGVDSTGLVPMARCWITGKCVKNFALSRLEFRASVDYLPKCFKQRFLYHEL